MKRILIADDIEENLYLLNALLVGHGYVVEQARNGSEALVKALPVPPDMIITDILMPVIDGFTLCRIWKADERLARIPFIFYTATYTDPRDERLALDMGADAFIVKPTEPDDFLRQIKTLLALSEQGKMAAPKKPKAGKEAILKEYNEVLIHKLEHKMLGLEKANRELEAEIAARRQVEAALRETEERYRLLFENSMDGVLLMEPGGTIVSANPEACSMFGRTEDGIRSAGRNGLLDLNDPRLAKALGERDRAGRFSGELTALRRDGSPFPCEVSSAIFKDSEGKLKTSMVIRDITERKRAEEKLIAALQEKEALLKEIHHRVKNNLQIISSMISLQFQSNARVMTADEISAHAQDLQNRILSIALVHEMLYMAKNLARIDFAEYVRNLVGSLFDIFHIKAQKITTCIEIAEQTIGITTAIPLGLIINEVLTNAIKYAFPSERKGEIRILMTVDNNDEYTLTVSDNGIGLPENFTIETARSFGMQLISVLVKQLGGSMSISNDNGITYTIRFKKRDQAGDLALFEKI
jgi:PAS domain S-box-containing protein